MDSWPLKDKGMMMKCQRCEVAPAVYECMECANRDELTPVQLCLDCSGMIHVGRLTSHTPTVTNVEAKRQVIKDKLKKFSRQTQGIKNKRHDIKAAKKDIQEQMHLYERNLRRTVQELQAMLKDRARDLFMQMKSEASASMAQLDEYDIALQQHLHTIKEVSNEVESVMNGDETVLEEAFEKVQEKMQVQMKPKDCLPQVPSLHTPIQLDLSGITEVINSLSITKLNTDEAVNMEQQEIQKGMTISVYVSGRMTRDGTFWVMPDLGEEALVALDRINSTIRKTYIMDLNWQTFDDAGTLPEVGDHVYVLFSSDQKWYRARVEETKSDRTCQVVYMDYGNIEVVNVNSMLPALENLFPNCPYQAVECSIFNELRTDFNMTVRWTFSDLVQEVPCECEFQTKLEEEGRNIWQVELHVEQDNEKINVNNIVKGKDSKAEDQKKNMGAITCRDIRLMDNPEMFSKLTTVTMERPREAASQSKPETAQQPKSVDNTVSSVSEAEGKESQPQSTVNEEPVEQTTSIESGVNHVLQALQEAHLITTVINGPQQHSTATETHYEATMQEDPVDGIQPQVNDTSATDDIPAVDEAPAIDDTPALDTCVPEEEVSEFKAEVEIMKECKEDEPTEAADGELHSEGAGLEAAEEVEEIVAPIPADSPSCEDYQSAASSLGDSSDLTALSSSSESAHKRTEPKDENITIEVSLRDSDQSSEWSPRKVSVEDKVPQSADGEVVVEEVASSDAGSPKEKDREATKESIKKKGKKKRKDSGSTDKKPVEKPVEKPATEQENPNEEAFNPEEWVLRCGQQPDQRQRIESRISEMFEEMEQDIVKVTPSVTYNICPGAAVFALGERDKWHRAIITDVSGRKVEVHFLDFPKSRTVSSDSLKYLPPKIRNLAPCCQLPKYVKDLVVEYYGEGVKETPQSQNRSTLVRAESADSVEVELAKTDHPGSQVTTPIHHRHGSQDEGMEDSVDGRLSANAAPFVPKRASVGNKTSSGPRRGAKKGEGRPVKERTGCYICGQIGHIKMDCPSNQSDSTVGGLNGAAWDHDRSAVECYGCGKYGHIRSDCPNERRDGGSQRPSREHRHHRDDRGYGKPRHYGSSRGASEGDRSNGSFEIRASEESW